MSKRNKIIYWVATAWLALGMLSTGIVQLLQIEKEVAFVLALGYPDYFLVFLGVSKILGVIAVLIPRFPILKEWAYCGFVLTMCGAIFSHIAAGNAPAEILPPLLLLALTIISWYFRPPDRKPIKTMNPTTA